MKIQYKDFGKDLSSFKMICTSDKMVINTTFEGEGKQLETILINDEQIDKVLLEFAREAERRK